MLRLDGSHNLIEECKPGFNFLQSFIGLVGYENLNGRHTVVDYKSESQVEFTEQDPDWHRIHEAMLDPRFSPSESKTPYEAAWEFAVELFCRMRIGIKNAYKAICDWGAKYSVRLTGSKVKQIISNARSTSGGRSIPDNLWHTERWIEDTNNRAKWKQIMIDATEILRQHISGSQWDAQNNHQKLAIRQLNHWQEGRMRCGINYWFQKFDSPGMQKFSENGGACYCKTAKACGAPACPECSLWQSERETAMWDWESAYGLQSPVLITFTVKPDSTPAMIKRAISMFSKRTGSGEIIRGCFGTFIPTTRGYSLQLMLPLARANVNGSVQTLVEKWSSVCSKLYDCHGSVSVSEPGLPAIELAVKLVLDSERELFRLVADREVIPSVAWPWFANWIGTKPGAKGMNRVYHSPGFRQFRIEEPELTSNTEDGSLDGISEEESDTEVESNFPRTWHSLESQVKRGGMLKLYDPYIQQEIYVDLGGNTTGMIPREYLDAKTMKPINAPTSGVQASPAKTGLTPKLIPIPPNGPMPVTITLPDPANLWSPYSPEQRARERGTWKGGRKQAVLEENTMADHDVLTEDPRIIVEKKLDPDEESRSLILRMF